MKADIWQAEYANNYVRLLDLENQIRDMRYAWAHAELSPQQLKQQLSQTEQEVTAFKNSL